MTVVLLGGGGFALELLDYLRQDNIQPIGYCAPAIEPEMIGVLEYIADEREYFPKDALPIIASGEVAIRRRIIEFVHLNYLRQFTFVSNYAYVSQMARFGDGLVACPNAVISGDARLGDDVLLNVSAMVGHSTRLKNNVVLAPHAAALGWSEIGSHTYIGANSVVLPHGKIGDNVTVGAATRVRDVGSSKNIFGAQEFYELQK